MTPTDTKARILDAAEQLFSQRGFAATSTRDITAAAAVNLAAVNYHFGAKAELVREVFRRRFGALNDERLARLARAEAEATPAAPSVPAIVRALVAPALHLGAEQGQACMRLMGRVHSEPAEFVVELVRDHFAEVRTRFLSALRRSVPDLSDEQAFLRLFFVVGAMAHSMGASHHLALLAAHGRHPFVLEEVEDELVRFGTAGILAEVGAAAEAKR
ncbi:MAG: TetR/AcrR family transcriptional regulator [Planctomycetota bacterium]